MNTVNLRIIDVYLLLTLVAIVLSLVSILSSWTRQREHTKLLTLLLGIFGVHILIILLFNSELFPQLVYGRMTYVFNLIYSPLLVVYWLYSQGGQKDWFKFYMLIWFVLGILLPLLSFKQEFYNSTVVCSYLISMLIFFRSLKSIVFFKHQRVELSRWYWFIGTFIVVFSGTYIYELTLTPQSFRSVSLMRFAYFTELFIFVITFLYYNQKAPSLFIKAKLVSMNLNTESHVLPSEIDLLTKEIEGNELYLKPDINRSMLHDLTGISPNRISEIINSHFNCNFSSWVNGYRIQEAKRRLLQESEEVSIKEIFYAVGFNTKSSFNKAFKEQTGQTPSQYRAQHLE